MTVARADAVALTRELVKIDSQNPSLVAGGSGEGPVAIALAGILEAWGCRVEVQEVAPGRPNVVARIGGGGTRSLMFNGHTDVVGVTGMSHAPFSAEEREGRIWGRGSSDMKAGIAAMCAAAVRAADQGAGEMIITAVIDEEYASLGTEALLTKGIRADAAIVTEPTRLAIMPAHRGFAWLDVEFTGRAAHGSRWDIGIDAIRHAGLFLAELDRYDRELLPTRGHPLLGRPSVHASTISGGTGMSTYPERCTLAVERRTIPGESPEAVVAELETLLANVRAADPRLDASVKLSLTQPPSDVDPDSPFVAMLGEAVSKCGIERRIEGMSAWTDAALLNAAGIPAICFGPGDIALAHAATEFVDRGEIEDATRVMTELALRWTSGG